MGWARVCQVEFGTPSCFCSRLAPLPDHDTLTMVTPRIPALLFALCSACLAPEAGRGSGVDPSALVILSLEAPTPLLEGTDVVVTPGGVRSADPVVRLLQGDVYVDLPVHSSSPPDYTFRLSRSALDTGPRAGT